MTDSWLVKELAEINNKGTPPGIVLVDSESMQTWMFLISVLGDETVYQVRHLSRLRCDLSFMMLLGRDFRFANEVWEPISHRMPRGMSRS